MNSSKPLVQFHSLLGSYMEQFIQMKQGCGYRYRTGTVILRQFDQYLCEVAPTERELSRAVTQGWLAKTPTESASTQRNRIGIVRQFAKFLCRLGHPAYVPEGALCSRASPGFAPRILTQDEVWRLLEAADQLVPSGHSPLRHLVMPEIFRLLYGCGFRLGEVVRLRIADVDLNRGVVTVRDGKFGKDRLVPLAIPLVQRLQRFSARFGDRPDDAFFFPTLHGGHWTIGAVYLVFRELLLRCGISHGGRGKGPRIHDLRHTFAVHALLRWYRDGEDLDAKLPILATYLGHQSLAGTQRYLHLTAELFPQITVRSNAQFGNVIPRRCAS